MNAVINEKLFQYAPILFEIDADEFVSVEPFMPHDISVTVQDNTATITGMYGIDIFSNHKFKLLVNGKFIVYTKLSDIPDTFNNIISFMPDDTHDKTFTFTFKKNDIKFTYTHWIHHVMEGWVDILQALIKRETNAGTNISV